MKIWMLVQHEGEWDSYTHRNIAAYASKDEADARLAVLSEEMKAYNARLEEATNEWQRIQEALSDEYSGHTGAWYNDRDAAMDVLCAKYDLPGDIWGCGHRRCTVEELELVEAKTDSYAVEVNAI